MRSTPQRRSSSLISGAGSGLAGTAASRRRRRSASTARSVTSALPGQRNGTTSARGGDAGTTAPSGKAGRSADAALAWVLSRGTDIIPLVGTKNRKRLADSLKALEVKLTPEELGQIEAAVPADAVAGTRYDSHGMAMLDSERRSA